MRNFVFISVILVFISYKASAQSVSGMIINDASFVLDGGITEDFSRRTLGVLALSYTAKKGLSFYADAQIFRGDNGSLSAGDIQAYSNIDENKLSKLYEIWMQKEFDDLGLRIKVGQVDANSEFAFVEHGSEFLNSSMGVSPSISELPTYPLPTVSFNAFLQTSPSTTWSLGVYSDESNEFDDVFSIGQWNKRINQINVALGAWHKTGGVSQILSEPLQDVDSLGSAHGYYATFGGNVNLPLFDSQNAGWFTQLAYTPARYSAITSHLGAGIQWYGVHGEQNNVFGMGFTYAEVNKNAVVLAPSAELALEVFYRFQLNAHIALKPDIQYIINPGTNANINNALVLSLRTEVAF